MSISCSNMRHAMICVYRVLVPFVLLASASACGKRENKWTTPSGLQIIEVTEGEGTLPRPGDLLSVLYTAWYVDGEQFDSYQDRSAPYKFRLGKKQILPGFDEGVATMRVGGKRILILPPELAFGSEERPGTVPANAWVRLEVEVVDIEPGPQPPVPWNEAGLEIVVTGTGLQYIDFVVGEGASPTPESKVTVHYSGFFDDGTAFDSTYFSGIPITFSLSEGELIPGWLQGLMSMRVGGSRKLIIPPFLGYGETGYRDKIPPNATLIYDIELLAVK